MAIPSVKVLYYAGDLAEVRVVVGEEYPTLSVKAVAFPRHLLDLVKEFGAAENEAGEGIPDISWPGVYCLLGPSADDPAKSCAYIGHSEGVYQRLCQHRSIPTGSIALSPYEWWTDTIVFVAASSGGLNKAHIAQLESCLVRSAIEVKNERWIVPKTKPSKDAGKLSPRDRISMSSLAKDMEYVANVLGWDLFRKPHSSLERSELPPSADSATPKTLGLHSCPKFTFSGRMFSATMRIGESGEFIVEKGSKARTHDMPMLDKGVAAERSKLVQNMILQEKNKHLEFTEDCAFPSVSRAASIVSGQNRNGNTAWKTSDGQLTYGQWLEQQIVGSDPKKNVTKRDESWKSPVFRYCGKGNTFAAKMRVSTAGEFVVMAGGKARLHTSPSTSSGVINERERLLNEKNLERVGAHLVFKQHCCFPSSRLSASVVRGHDVNGNTAWKLPDGRTLGQWQESEDRKRGKSDTDDST